MCWKLKRPIAVRRTSKTIWFGTLQHNVRKRVFLREILKIDRMFPGRFQPLLIDFSKPNM